MAPPRQHVGVVLGGAAEDPAAGEEETTTDTENEAKFCNPNEKPIDYVPPSSPIGDSIDFIGKLKQAGSRLIIIKVSASWCPPSERIKPFFIQLRQKYPNVLFLDVDSEYCRDIVDSYDIDAY